MNNIASLRAAGIQVDLLSAEADRLMRDHAEAMICFDTEKMIRDAISHDDWFCARDALFREYVADGKIEYDPAYETWATSFIWKVALLAETLIRLVEVLREYAIEGEAELRALDSKLRASLETDASIFTPEKVDRLQSREVG